MLDDILDISDALFNSGLEKTSDAVIMHGADSYSGKIIFRNQYQRNNSMDFSFAGSALVAVCKYDMVDDWNTIEESKDTIKIEDENGGAAFIIREIKPVTPCYVILSLSYD